MNEDTDCGVYNEYGYHDWEDVTVGPYVVDRQCTCCKVLMSKDNDEG